VTGPIDGLTIQEAAVTTGWSPRMLRYIERSGLVEPPRTPAGYRIFGAEELQRLRTLRELLQRFHCGLSDVAFTKRLRSDRALREALERWFEDRARRPDGVASADWLRFEQEKHQRLLAA
jgi:MerR family copper efflux transcriptional regulator